MKKASRNIIMEIIIIIIVSIISFFLSKILIGIGPESTMKGWVETYIIIIVVSALAIYIIDKELKLSHKITGTISSAIITLSTLYLGYLFAPRELVGVLLIIGYLIILPFSKTFYLALIFNSKRPKEDN